MITHRRADASRRRDRQGNRAAVPLAVRAGLRDAGCDDCRAGLLPRNRRCRLPLGADGQSANGDGGLSAPLSAGSIRTAPKRWRSAPVHGLSRRPRLFALNRRRPARIKFQRDCLAGFILGLADGQTRGLATTAKNHRCEKRGDEAILAGRRWDVSSPRQRPAVAARVGAGEQHAGSGVAADDLDAARARRDRRPYRPDGRAAPARAGYPPESGAPSSARPARHADNSRIAPARSRSSAASRRPAAGRARNRSSPSRSGN